MSRGRGLQHYDIVKEIYKIADENKDADLKRLLRAYIWNQDYLSEDFKEFIWEHIVRTVYYEQNP